MGKPVGWRNESGRHSLAARGIPTTMESRGISDASESMKYDLSGDFDGLHNQMYELERVGGVTEGDPESMESFMLFAEEIINNAENLGLGNEKYIRHLKKAKSNIEKALIDSQFQYKYLRKTHRPFQIGGDLGEKVYRSKANDDLSHVFSSNAYQDFRMKLKDMEMRRKLL